MTSKSRRLTIKRPFRDVSLRLDASLQVEWEKAEADLIKARKANADRLASSEVARLAGEVQALEAQMLASDVAVFRLQAVSRSKWAEVIAAHPADASNAEDAAFGADRAAFFDDMIPLSIVGVTQDGEPVEFDVETDWDPLADEMTDWQYSQFIEAVYVLNRGAVSVPFSQAASRLSQG